MYGKVCKYRGSECFQTLAFPVLPEGQAVSGSSTVTREEEIEGLQLEYGPARQPPPLQGTWAFFTQEWRGMELPGVSAASNLCL
jgi:hypothetical protein